MIFTYSLQLLMDQRYGLLGQVLLWSVAQGGPCLPVLSPSLFDVITGDEPTQIMDEVNHVHPCVKDNLEKVRPLTQLYCAVRTYKGHHNCKEIPSLQLYCVMSLQRLYRNCDLLT